MNTEPELQADGRWRTVINGVEYFDEGLSLAYMRMAVAGVL